MPLRTLIVDDEEPARWRVRELLARHEDIAIVGECSNGRDALAAVEALRPDLLFLDVQMPEVDGFRVLGAIRPEILPLTVFVTAYDHYAVRAFETHALDYVLKPFSDERLELALTRARERLQARHRDEWAARVLALLREQTPPFAPLLPDAPGALSASGTALASPSVQPSAASAWNGAIAAAPPAAPASPASPTPSPLTRLAVRSHGEVLVLDPRDIDWIEAAGVYVQVHVGRQAYLHRIPLSELEARLSHARFVRIHRSTLVNLDRVRALAPQPHGEFTVILTDGTSLRLSRRYRAHLEASLGQPL